MADFRKWMLALTVLVVFAGLASAQTGINCTATAVPPQLRGEGFTEQVGDILLTCTGANPSQTANITVYLNQTVTSRILNSTANVAGQFPSDAMLLINDPAPGVQTTCGATAPNPPVSCAAFNMIQGYVSGSAVSFYGVPVLPPNTANPAAGTTYRITNVRVNANGLSGGGNIPNPAQAAVTISSSTSIQVNNSFLTVGYVSNSLKTSVNAIAPNVTKGPSINLQQCSSSFKSTAPPGPLETLTYTELQGSAFKPRGTTNQNTPGTIYYTESGFTPVSPTNAGYADWGTRLKAVFNNIPSGVTIYVSTVNIDPLTSSGGATSNSSSYAQLVVSETAQYNTTGSAGIPTIPAAGTTTSLGGSIGYVPLTNVGGSATAVWEVVNAIQSTPETLNFGVFISYTPNLASNLPTPGTATVNMSYAPTYTGSVGGVASSTLGIPRFADTSVATNALVLNICQTALLYPYVINTNGFDTGLAVANTTADPFGTSAQSGSCAIHWYGSNAPSDGFLGSAGYQTTAPTSSQLIAAGTVASWGASVAAPGFSGYVIAVCNFQYAHGFAFVSDLGARNLAMGYLADILGLNVGGGNPRGPSPTESNGQ